MRRKILIFLAILFFSLNSYANFTIGRIKYEGGGDWYTDPSALRNWLKALEERFDMDVKFSDETVVLSDKAFFKYPILFISGHGNIKFSNEEVKNLREYLLNGGFLYANDDYGMDTAFRREMKKVFPELDFVQLPFSHRIFHIFYDMKYFPKVHKHAGKPPQLLAIIKNGRILVLYSYEADIGDGITDWEIFKDKKEDREEAMKFVLNLIVYLFLEN